MILKTSSFCMIVLMLFACSNKREIVTRDVKVKAVIETLEEDHKVVLADITSCDFPIFENFNYLRLNSTATPIAEPQNLIIGNDVYIILDRYVSQGVFVFDFQGKLVSSVEALGRGPGEISDFTSVSLSSSKRQVHLYDNLQRRIKIYDLDNGSYIDDFSVQYRLKDFKILNDSLYLGSLDDFNNLEVPNLRNKGAVIFSKDGTVQTAINELLEVTENKWFPRHDLHEFQTGVIYAPRFQNKVFAVNYSDLSVNLLASFDLGTSGINQETFAAETKEFLKTVVDTRKYYFGSSSFQVENYLITEFTNRRAPLYNILNLSTGKNIFVRASECFNNLSSTLEYFGSPLASDGDRLYNIVTAETLSLFGKGDKGRFSVKFSQLIENTDYEDNPVIVSFQLSDQVKRMLQ